MDIQALLKQYGPSLIQILTQKAGLSSQQAQSLLPVLLEKVIGILNGGGFDLKSLLGGDVASILSKLDMGGLAKQTGIEQAKVEAGAKQVVPDLMKQLQSQTGGLEGLLGKLGGGSGGASDLIKQAGKLFGGS